MSGPTKVRVAGNPQTVEQGFSYTIRRGSNGGAEVERAWMGTGQAVLARMANLMNLPVVTEISAQQAPGSAVALIRARFSVIPGQAEEHVEESLSLRWATQMIELHRNPTFIGISTNRIKALNDDAEKESPTAPTDPTELKYFNLIRRGVKAYPASLPIVTYTRVAPRNTVERLNVSNSGKIFGAVDVPVSSFFVLGDINIGLSTGTGFTAGWKLTADGDYLANGNSQLVETYEFGLWEDDLFDFV
jgi:hypothetical protein